MDPRVSNTSSASAHSASGIHLDTSRDSQRPENRSNVAYDSYGRVPRQHPVETMQHSIVGSANASNALSVRSENTRVAHLWPRRHSGSGGLALSDAMRDQHGGLLNAVRAELKGKGIEMNGSTPNSSETSDKESAEIRQMSVDEVQSRAVPGSHPTVGISSHQQTIESAAWQTPLPVSENTFTSSQRPILEKRTKKEILQGPYGHVLRAILGKSLAGVDRVVQWKNLVYRNPVSSNFYLFREDGRFGGRKVLAEIDSGTTPPTITDLRTLTHVDHVLENFPTLQAMCRDLDETGFELTYDGKRRTFDISHRPNDSVAVTSRPSGRLIVNPNDLRRALWSDTAHTISELAYALGKAKFYKESGALPKIQGGGSDKRDRGYAILKQFELLDSPQADRRTKEEIRKELKATYGAEFGKVYSTYKNNRRELVKGEQKLMSHRRYFSQGTLGTLNARMQPGTGSQGIPLIQVIMEGKVERLGEGVKLDVALWENFCRHLAEVPQAAREEVQFSDHAPESANPENMFVGQQGNSAPLTEFSGFFSVRRNEGDGDCLYFALNGTSSMSPDALRALRRDVAEVRRKMPDTPQQQALNANQVAGALYQTNPAHWQKVGAMVARKDAVPNAVYAAMQAVPGVYAGEDELIQWCQLTGKSVAVASDENGSLAVFTGDERREVPLSPDNSQQIIRETLAQADLALYKTENHWERIDGLVSERTSPSAKETAMTAKPQPSRKSTLDFSAIAKTVATGISSMKGKNIDNTMKPLPQEMHFYWLGTLGGIQKEYALQWLKTNPDYKLSLWYDNSALLAYELKRRIQHHVEREVGSDEGRLTQTTWRLQEQAHAAIAEQMAEGKSFDQAAADFMIKVLGAAPQDLEGVLQANFRSFEECVTMLKASVPGSDVRLVDYSTLRVSAGRTTSTHYLQEFGLRGNLAAAKDIASLEVMDHVGGLYIDLDLLPEVNDELFAHVSRGTPPVALDDFEFAKTQAILDELAQNSADLDHREELKRKGVYTDYLQRMRNEGYADVADALVNAVRNRGGRNVFKPLGEIKVVRDGMRILKMREGLVNGCLGAYPGSKALRLAKDKIVRNYEVPAQTNADFPKDEAAIKEATGKVMDKLLESGISKENAYFTARIAGYRLDGIQAKMQSQIYLAGSAVLKEALGDLYGANWHNDERFVFKPVNNYTEEEIKSSWRKS